VGTSVDFDIGGSIGVRLLDGSESDVASVRRQLGEPSEPLTRAPDVNVRFVERLPLEGATLVTSRGSCFTDEGFLILHAERSRVRAQIPLWELGGACEIVCESGGRAVPLLLEAVKLVALKRGLIALPASAFEFEGTGILVVGGAQGGKTSALIAFARQGALFVGDDLVFVRSDGKQMFGLHTPLSVTTRQIRELPTRGPAAATSPTERLSLAVYEQLENIRAWSVQDAPSGSLRERLSASVAPTIRHKLTVRRTPEELFAGALADSAEPKQLFITLGHDASDVRVKGVTAEDFIDRAANLLHSADLPLLAYHLDYRVAGLGEAQPFIERAHELRRSLLERAFAGKEAYVVRRPPVAELDSVFRAMTRARGEPQRSRVEPGSATEPRNWRSKPRGPAKRTNRG
jgi:hypothetical protein